MTAAALPPPLRSGPRPALVMVVAVTILALPSAVLGISTRFDTPQDNFSSNQGSSNQGMGSFAPGQGDPRLSRALAARGMQAKGPLFRFTPAGLAARPDRSVTVAVRVDEATARTIVVRGPSLASRLAPKSPQVLRIAPTAYNLGLSRGFQNFSGTLQSYSLPHTEARRQDLPDLSALVRNDSNTTSESRLVPHIALGERERAGRAPRTLESAGEQSVDLGGAYRVTRNLDVTAGVRYSQDRDRLKPALDGKADSQAVFVGTQFRF